MFSTDTNHVFIPRKASFVEMWVGQMAPSPVGSSWGSPNMKIFLIWHRVFQRTKLIHLITTPRLTQRISVVSLESHIHE